MCRKRRPTPRRAGTDTIRSVLAFNRTCLQCIGHIVQACTSAANLTPGRYTADLRVVVDDFYGTQVLVPVEVNVLTARSRIALGSGAGEQSDQPTAIQLGNYPNPFSASTTIRLELATGSDVRIHVYDMTGREVRMLQDGYLSMEMHEFRFEADDLPSGTYLYRVSSSAGQETGTMTLVR